MVTTSSLYLIDEFLNRPDAPLLLKQLNAHFKEEKKKRVNFYNEIDDSIKAEFINGEVIIHSPVVKAHNEANGNLYLLLKMYAIKKKLGFVGIEKILVKFSRNDYEPDLCYFDKEKSALFLPDQKLFPVPNFIVEVLSNSTEKRDRGVKFKDYESHGVGEYWLVDVKNKIVEQYILSNGKYHLRLKSGTGLISSESLEGLVFPIDIIFDEEKASDFVASIFSS